MPSRRPATCLAALALAIAACRGERTPQSLVLITIDTLRADRLGAYGWPRGTSPAIDALARDATLFETAVPTCSATAPSLASLLTGTHRATHRVFGNGWVLPAEVVTLAELLKARGYRTIARMANPGIDASTGFAQGFDDFVIPPGLESSGPGMLEGGPLVADVEHVVQGLGREPFFLWVHFMDTHGPYFPPQALRDRFAPADYRWPGDPDALPLGASNFGLGIIPRYQVVNDETSPASYRARYDAEVRYADDHVGAIVRALEARGLWDSTLFVLTADHGESLGEHDYYFAHGWYVSDDQLRVPLLVHGPGIPRGRRVRGSVSLVDVAPTVLDLFGLERPAAMEGATLRPLLGADEPDRDAFAQTFYGEGLVALRSGPMKYVFKPPRSTATRSGSDPPFADGSQEWLFDLTSDPGETSNLLESRRDVAAAMRGRLQAWLRAQEARGRGHAAEQPRQGNLPMRVLGDPQLERQLRALGYVE
jgi:arylsulfatase